MKRLLEAQASVPGSAADAVVVFTVLEADAKGMIGSLGSFRPYTLRFIGDGGNEVTVKKIVAKPAVHEQGQAVVLKSTNGWPTKDLNDMVGPNTDGVDLPRYSVADGYELHVTCDNANAGAVVLTLAMKVENAVGPDPTDPVVGLDPFFLRKSRAAIAASGSRDARADIDRLDDRLDFRAAGRSGLEGLSTP